MKGEILPDTDNATRFCSGGRINGEHVSGAAFELREDDDYLSINWIEHFNTLTEEDAVKRINEDNIKDGLTVRKTGRFAKLNIDETKKYVKDESGTILKFIHEPIAGVDESHSGIYGYDQSDDGMIVAELIAEKVQKLIPPSSTS